MSPSMSIWLEYNIKRTIDIKSSGSFPMSVITTRRCFVDVCADAAAVIKTMIVDTKTINPAFLIFIFIDFIVLAIFMLVNNWLTDSHTTVLPPLHAQDFECG